MTEPATLTFLGEEGVTLAGEAWGSADRGTVLFAHGGGQTRHAWAKACGTIANAGWRAISLDLRGHGESGWSPTGDYSILRFAGDLIQVSRQLGAPPALVGASLGGIAGMLVEAVLAPRTFASLTLVDVTPQLDPGGVAKVMGFMSERVGDGFGSVEEAADYIASYLPHRPRPNDLSGLAKNLRLHPDGRYRWHWDPRFVTSVTESRSIYADASFNSRLSGLAIPVHLIRGRSSELVSHAAAEAFLAAVPHAHFTDVAEAGHMVAGDRNDVFVDAVLSFLTRTSD